MKRQPFTASGDWIAYFYENAHRALRHPLPDPVATLPPRVHRLLAGSLPAWQLGETSDGRHLLAAARQYATRHGDPLFLSAVTLFIREEQRHGAALGAWLDAVGIPRRRRDWGDSLFRMCRYAIPNYAAWASVVVMVESMAEIYYAAVRRLAPCPRLRAECTRILRDEVAHLRFQCEHLAFTRRSLPRPARRVLRFGEAVFFAVVAGAVWIAHGRLLAAGGVPAGRFAVLAARKFGAIQARMDPARYDFAAPPALPHLLTRRFA